MVINNNALISKIKELARIHNIPEAVVQDVFNSQFQFFRETVGNLNFHDAVSEEEIMATKTNFNYKYLGKFYTHPKRVKKIQEIKIKNNIEDERD